MAILTFYVAQSTSNMITINSNNVIKLDFENSMLSGNLGNAASRFSDQILQRFSSVISIFIPRLV